MEKDGAKAADLYEETCFKHGYAESCLSLGNIYITGNGKFAKGCNYSVCMTNPGWSFVIISSNYLLLKTVKLNIMQLEA